MNIQDEAAELAHLIFSEVDCIAFDPTMHSEKCRMAAQRISDLLMKLDNEWEAAIKFRDNRERWPI